MKFFAFLFIVVVFAIVLIYGKLFIIAAWSGLKAVFYFLRGILGGGGE